MLKTIMPPIYRCGGAGGGGGGAGAGIKMAKFKRQFLN